MTVKELIEELKQLQPDMHVVSSSYESGLTAVVGAEVVRVKYTPEQPGYCGEYTPERKGECVVRILGERH